MGMLSLPSRPVRPLDSAVQANAKGRPRFSPRCGLGGGLPENATLSLHPNCVLCKEVVVVLMPSAKLDTVDWPAVR